MQATSEIAGDYGADVAGLTLPSPAEGGTQAGPLSPEQTDTEVAGPEQASGEESYEGQTKAALLEDAENRGLDVSTTNTKSEIIDALKADDEA